VIFTFPNIEQKITLSAVGGPTSVDIVSGNNTYPLIKNVDNGLWSGILSFSKAGIYELTAKAIDGAKNRTERKLNTVVALDSGKILEGNLPVTSGQVALWYLDSQTQRFALWDGESYGQSNPQAITKNGEYGFFAPAGTYYLEVKSFGFKTLRTEIFTLSETTPILADLKLEKSLSFNLGPLTIPLPDFSVSKQSVNIKSPAVPAGAKLTDNIVGTEPPNVDILLDSQNIPTISFLGKPTVFTFLSTWSPYASEQLKSLGELSGNSQINVVPVVSQESSTSVTVFRKRGGYSFPIYSDPDGLLVKPFSLSFLPTTIFIDRKGIVQKVKVGVLTSGELLENVVN
jgi:peroxiredoxin